MLEKRLASLDEPTLLQRSGVASAPAALAAPLQGHKACPGAHVSHGFLLLPQKQFWISYNGE